jgi:hypothetical protein
MNPKFLDDYKLLTKKKNGNHSLSNSIVVDLRMKQDIDNLSSYLDVYGSMPYPKTLKKVMDGIR